MPKVYLTESERVNARFKRWYYISKHDHGITDQDVGRKLGKSHQAISRKMGSNASGRITLEEMSVIFHFMQASNEDILKIFGR